MSRTTSGFLAVLLLAPSAVARADDLRLTLRTRVIAPGYGADRAIETPASWDPKRTAVIVCDMWDLHHCLNATRRVGELAPRIDVFVKAVRARGGLVIHAPSDCIGSYKGHPARTRAQTASSARSLPSGIEQWCRKIPAEESASYPVDQTDGGEDDDPAEHARWQARLTALGRNPKAPWKRQTDAIAIDPERDLISADGPEIWNALEDRGVANVMLVGVHLNMCVLGRPFGLRQMAKNGKNVVLVRDLTDTMYNPLKAPFVSHFSGTDRVVAHVERHVCPSVTSDQVVGGAPFRFKDDLRPRVAFLVAEDEYKTETTLPAFAARHLAKDFAYDFIFDRPDDKNRLTGLGALRGADVLFVSARRRLFDAKEVEAFKDYVASGGAVVGIRTASHAFSPKSKQPVPEGHAAWPEFDAEVLGGHYSNHHASAAPLPGIRVAEGATDHPILAGVDVASLSPAHGTLYKVSPLAPSATALLVGEITGAVAEPVAWTSLSPSGGRVAYTSLGHPGDFESPAFARLLRNAVAWAARRDPASLAGPASVDPIAFPK